ncbi:hypothetical protein BIY06_03225 [Mycoplasmoides pneumoniae]|nr:hypothetical protein BIX64_02085 [Mycoplasmoides pneumoniae]PFH39432.1 hypothetical protein BIY06_03225 [Mycoplasmoides pneumoniae]
MDVVRAAHLHPSYELVDWKRVGQNKLVALVRSALVRVKFQDTTSSDSNNQDTSQNALSFDTQESQKALNGSQSGSSDTSGSNSQDFASYILIFQGAPRATWVFERKIKLALPYVKQESQGSDDQGSNGKGSLYTTLQDLLVEQPVTPYTPNAGLARVNGVAQDTVHFGSGQESSWNSQRSQKGLKTTPLPRPSPALSSIRAARTGSWMKVDRCMNPWIRPRRGRGRMRALGKIRKKQRRKMMPRWWGWLEVVRLEVLLVYKAMARTVRG